MHGLSAGQDPVRVRLYIISACTARIGLLYQLGPTGLIL